MRKQERQDKTDWTQQSGTQHMKTTTEATIEVGDGETEELEVEATTEEEEEEEQNNHLPEINHSYLKKDVRDVGDHTSRKTATQGKEI